MASFVIASASPVLLAANGTPLEAESNTSFWLWNLLIATIVLAATAGSAVLPIAALRYWQGRWRYFAWFPLLALLLWVSVIVAGKLLDPNSHQLWAFEIFSWAMINTIYMVAVMTAKRTLEKYDDKHDQKQDPEQA